MYLLGLNATHIIEKNATNCSCASTDISYAPSDISFWMEWHRHTQTDTIVINSYGRL